MIRNTDILIQRLKLQPRQGTDITEDDAERARIQKDLKDIAKGAQDALGKIADSYRNVYEAFNTTQLALQTGISKMSGIFDGYSSAMVGLAKEATFLEQRNKALNKSFGLSSIKAAELGQKYDEMTEILQDGGENIRKYGQSVDKILPGMSKMIMGANAAGKNFKTGFSTQLLGTNQLLTEHIGLTGDAANNYQLYAAGAGQNSLDLLNATQQWAESFDKATGMAGSFAGIIKDISDLGADVQTQYNKYPGQLEKAVVKAKLLGTTFKQIEAMATKMLDIESSVGQELEYQLLSGKRLVNQQGESITENLRIAKLSGNAEDQVKAMNDLLESQGDILDGNNHYAKEQLAQLTGYTVAELTRQRQTRKLMEQGGMTEADIDKIMSLDPAAFEEALKGKSADQQAILKNLKESESQKTTDEKFADFLDKERTEGIRVMAGNQLTAITQAKTDVEGGYTAAANFGKQFLSKPMAESIGKVQLLSGIFDATLKPVTDLTEMLPLVGTALTKFTDNLKTLKNTITGTATSKTKGRTGPDGDITETPEDAVLVNDAMIQFHPADKFATVSDGAALLASTERGKLDSAVDSLMGRGGSGTAVVDPGPIAAAIMSALSSMKVEVNYDVVAAQKAIGFKFNQSIN